MGTQDDGFIGRWSRRKAENAASGGLQKTTPEVVEPVRGRMITDPLPVKESEPDDIEADIVLAADANEDEKPVEVADTTPDIEELESINIEALDYDADFTKFMQAGVPERLRQRALRRLWSTNPILANVDGLNDYDEDYTDAALAVDVLKTSWKVGQGYLTDEEVVERDADRLDEDDKTIETDAPVAELSEDTDIEDDPDGDGDPHSAVLADASSMTDDAEPKTGLERQAEKTGWIPADADGDLETDEA